MGQNLGKWQEDQGYDVQGQTGGRQENGWVGLHEAPYCNTRLKAMHGLLSGRQTEIL